jgi:hypothetical protein
MEKKADTGAVEVGVSSVSSELKNIEKVTDTTSPITNNQVELYIKGEKKEPTVEPTVEPKKIFLECTAPLKMLDLMIVKKEEPSVVLVAPVVAPVKDNTKNDRKIVMMEEENVILLSSSELKQHILGTIEEQNEQQKEKVRAFHKMACIQLLQQVKCYETPVDSDDEDSVPLSREELRRRVLRELENSKKVTITEKSVPTYLKEISKEKVKTPPLEPVKEETIHDVHPFLLEYGVNPIKTNTIMIDNHIYHKNNVLTAPAVSAAPTNMQHINKKNKKKKH